MLSGPAIPVVTLVSPDSGPYVGGNTVTITGTGFTGATTIRFWDGDEGQPIFNVVTFSVLSDTRLTLVAPKSTYFGSTNVLITTPAGTNPGTVADEYSFTSATSIIPPHVTGLSPDSGPYTGGNSVTITGTGLTATTVVDFGSVPATSFVTHSDTQITAVAPPQPAGTVANVTVTNSAGMSASNSASSYFFVMGLTVTTQFPVGSFRDPYAGSLSVSGGLSPYHLVIGGSLPPGLAVTQASFSTWSVSGTPTLVGFFNFIVTVTDSANATYSEHLSISIAPDVEPPQQASGGVQWAGYSSASAPPVTAITASWRVPQITSLGGESATWVGVGSGETGVSDHLIQAGTYQGGRNGLNAAWVAEPIP